MISGLHFKQVNNKGRGVFCTQPVKEGRVIEICPLLIMPGNQFSKQHQTKMEEYWFYFNREDDLLALALGFGSLYNHACPANAQHDVDYQNKALIITALEFIPPNTEICINYNGCYNDSSLKWFEQHKIQYVR